MSSVSELTAGEECGELLPGLGVPLEVYEHRDFANRSSVVRESILRFKANGAGGGRDRAAAHVSRG